MAAYEAIKELSSDKGYPVDKLCKYLNITRSAYYHWLKYPKSNSEIQNESIFLEIKKIHEQHPDMGYRRIRDELDGHEVSRKIEEVENVIIKDLGCKIHAPLMHLSFLGLSTSPAWKITDKGLIDVNNFKILDPIIK